MALSPKDHPELFDVLIMAGDRVSPGRVRLNGHDRNKAWDIKAAKGQTGASSTLNGDPLGEFEATFELVEDPYDGVDDFADWEEFSRWLHSLVNGPKPLAVTVYHPDLATNNFTEVTVRSIGGVLRQDNGVGIVKVKFGEHKPPKPKPVKKSSASGSANSPDKPEKPDPNAEAKRELERLTTQADSL
jgi:hypothetical protein